MEQARDIQREKMIVALSSVVAAIGLTGMKLVVGLLTGSLGILAEAAHSGLDLVAALMTFFAVRLASRPADVTHHYGHGKVENLSAFLEAGLLVLTAIWVSIRLAKDTIDALLDRAPDTIVEQVQTQVRALPDVLEVRRVRMRRAGNKFFADVVVAAPRTFTFEQTHMLTEQVEQAAREAVRTVSPQGDIDIVVHVEPTASPSETVAEQIHYLAETQGINAHDIHVREVSGHLEADFDLEVPADMALADAHTVASRLEEAVRHTNQQVQQVNTHLADIQS